MKQILTLVLTLALTFVVTQTSQAGKANTGTFGAGNGTFLLNGKPFVVKAAEVHYPRIPRPYWEHRIKMCKALGMNTLCLYVFWNIHEQQEGVFDFTGQNDVAEFCRLAQKNGMYVIVRPGPYVCAEWEMGGLPWWLLKKKDVRLREQDPYFMERVRLFEQKVGEQLSPLTIGNGGPIIMIQVENEYGSYGEDKAYVSAIRDCLRDIYGDVTLFQCDWASNFTRNGLDDLLWTMNFGTGADIDKQFARLRELRPDSPLMCSEFWSGWFDKWGARHETRPAKAMVDGIDEMLSKRISFSLYMTHGGTSFGHWAGANSPGFAPDVTSYDYDAPINEYGLPTEKYWLLRETLQKHSSVKLPAVPKAPMPLITIPEVRLQQICSLEQLATRTVSSRDVKTFEEMDMGWGTAIYTTTMPAVAKGSILTINDPHDYVLVYLDGKLMGTIDRVKNEKSLMLPEVVRGQQLKLVVEGMGRINFGRAIKDFKGITSNVVIKTETDAHEVTITLKNWQIALVPDDNFVSKTDTEGSDPSVRNFETKCSTFSPGMYRATFNLNKVGDTFVNMERWGKGQLYVNGYAIGRYWSVGPQQTLYVPGCWLRKGKNEMCVVDISGPRDAVVWGQQKPELDKLQMKAVSRHDMDADKPDLTKMKPAASGTTAQGNGWQTLALDSPQRGRHIAIEILATHDGKPVTAVAEIYALDTNGKRLSREPWTAKYADSEDMRGNNSLDKVFDLQESTFWQTEKKAALPHLMVIDLGAEQTVTAIDYLPRAEQSAPGSFSTYRIYVY